MKSNDTSLTFWKLGSHCFLRSPDTNGVWQQCLALGNCLTKHNLADVGDVMVLNSVDSCQITTRVWQRLSHISFKYLITPKCNRLVTWSNTKFWTTHFNVPKLASHPEVRTQMQEHSEKDAEKSMWTKWYSVQGACRTLHNEENISVDERKWKISLGRTRNKRKYNTTYMPLITRVHREMSLWRVLLSRACAERSILTFLPPGTPFCKKPR
jgi:hypothetical protein